MLFPRWLIVDEENGGDGSSEGKIDVEAPDVVVNERNLAFGNLPSPSQFAVREGAAEERSPDTSNNPDGADPRRIQWSLSQGHHASNQDEHAGDNTAGSCSSNSSPKDEELGARRNAAQQRTELENSDGTKKNPFGWVVFIKFAAMKLKSTHRQQAGRNQSQKFRYQCWKATDYADPYHPTSWMV